MKVLYVCPNGFFGGAERFVYETNLCHLSDSTIESCVLFFNDGVGVDKAREVGIRYHVLENTFKVSRPFLLLKALGEIKKFVKESNCDIVHSTMSYTHFIIGIALIGMRTKRVWFQHGPVGSYWDFLASLFPVDTILFNTNYLRDEHNRGISILKAKKGQRIVELGVSTSNEQEVLKKKEFTALCAGRINSLKGISETIKAFSSFSKDKDVYLDIAGEATSESEKSYLKLLQGQVKEYGLEKKVRFLGYIKEMDSLFKSSHVMILGSLVPESFGLVAAEAMLNETLVIASSDGGTGDFLKNLETGLCYHPGTESAEKDLVDHLDYAYQEWLTHKDAYCLEIRERAKTLISEKYSQESSIRKLKEAYTELLVIS